MTTAVRSLSRLRGRAGVGVLPQNTLPEWIDFPHPPQAGEAKIVAARYGK